MKSECDANSARQEGQWREWSCERCVVCPGHGKLASVKEEVNTGEGDGLRIPLMATVLAAGPKQGLWPTTKTKSF